MTNICVTECFDSEMYGRRMEQFKKDVTVYPVSCEKLAAGRTDREWLDSVLRGGAQIVQLRDKESPAPLLLEKAHYFRQKTREAGVLFMVNDRLDIALLCDADGLHIGQDDLAPEEIRRLAPNIILGLSCNSEQDAEELNAKISKEKNLVSYFNVGPLYPTGTKEGLKEFVGPEAIQKFSQKCSLPFTVMGGIKYTHIKKLVQHGAKRIAVVTALTQADDIAAETDRWVKGISTYLATEKGDV